MDRVAPSQKPASRRPIPWPSLPNLPGWANRTGRKITGVIRPLENGDRLIRAEFERLYDHGKEAAMIELTDQQMKVLENLEATPPRLVNPRTMETFVLLRVDEYERLTEEYDDSP